MTEDEKWKTAETRLISLFMLPTYKQTKACHEKSGDLMRDIPKGRNTAHHR